MKHELFVVNKKGKLIKSKHYKILISSSDNFEMYFYPATGEIYGSEIISRWKGQFSI